MSASEENRETKLSPFPMRVVEVFFSPGKLTAALAEHPVWAAALVFGIALMLAQTLLIPADVWQTMVREQMIAQGQDPNAFKGGGTMFRLFGLAGALIGYPLMVLITAGLTTLVFAFVLGDEGRFRQYLAVTTHALLITLVVGMALLPLKIIQQDPRLTLNLGTFLVFLKKGYVYRWAKMMDLSNVWAWLVIAQGVVAIDKRRTFRSAAMIVLVMFLIFTALIALLPGTG